MNTLHGQFPAPFALCGVPPAATALAAARLIAESGARVALLACPNLGRAESIAEEIPFFAANSAAMRAPAGSIEGAPPRIHALPPPAVAGAAPGAGTEFDTHCDLLNALAAVRHHTPGEPPLVFACSPDALAQPCPPPEAFAGRELTLRAGDSLQPRALAATLVQFGYYNEALCETPGQFAVRGGIVDIYPLNATAPVRVDFFGDTIESIRLFDPATQRSDASLGAAPLHITAGTTAGEETGGVGNGGASGDAPRAGAFVTHLPAGVLWIIAEPESFSEAQLAALAAGIRPQDRLALISEFDETPASAALPPPAEVRHWEGRDLATLQPVVDDNFSREEDSPKPKPATPARRKTTARRQIRASDDALLGVDRLSAEEAARENLLRELARRQREGAVVQIVVETVGAIVRLRQILADADGAGNAPFSPEICQGIVSAGFVLERFAEGVPALVVATEHEIFGRRRRRIPAIRSRRLPRKSRVEQLLDFSEVADGDYLVHLQHGICVYRGINPVNGEEMISLEFDDRITTHLPLREAHLLSRYVSLRKLVPKLGKIGSGAWQRTRRAAEVATVDFAAELLASHASRRSRPGIAFPPSEEQPWLREMEATFPFQETPDQTRAIAETMRDMERPEPMDRLLCGDVGFGKTEVALRAVFKAVLAGRQAAILAPTTVLAQQHFNTFRERLSKYPVSIEMLSRFRAPAQRRRILAQINDGRLDIIIGTHALLAEGVKFPRLGLLVIDEEHRFGVKQKEAIQRARSEVDVLCMSATPIPRTLHLALQGARELSVIETPPRERLPIRTLVRAYDIKLVQEAIRYEIERGGQVFYLHNRVDTIAQTAARLSELMPDVRFGVGHGQMPEHELEDLMTAFVAGRFDVLVCTTIIETGLDIPNCNTLLIEGADRFGLAQLYQLRGRVGRFNRQAYAYLLLHKHAALLDPARRRLSAIRQHNQLGAGLRIAMRDLELRGVGNLLGREQSGHVAGVGFDLYCQLLRQSIARLKGDPLAAAIRCELRLDFVHLQGFGNSDPAISNPDGESPEPLFDDELPTADTTADDAAADDKCCVRHSWRTTPLPTATSTTAPSTTPATRATARATPATAPRTPPARNTNSATGDWHALREEDLEAGRVTSEITATLPPAYITDTRLRIDIYRRLALAPTPDAVLEVAADMRDRFGPPPPAAAACIALSEIRAIAESRGVVSIETDGPRLKCRLARPAKDGSAYLKTGANFPRITSPTPLARLKEIRLFLLRQPSITPKNSPKV